MHCPSSHGWNCGSKYPCFLPFPGAPKSGTYTQIYGLVVGVLIAEKREHHDILLSLPLLTLPNPT